MDLYIWLYNGITFWLERIPSHKFCCFTNRYYLENRFCSRVFNLLNVFAEFSFHARIKTNNCSSVYLLTTGFCYHFCRKFRKRRLEFGEITFGGVDICWRLFGNPEKVGSLS